jgi:ribosomal protein S18 acetylase RimI-like enzyme
VKQRSKSNPQAEVLFTCPCCGYRTLKEPPGSYSICPICFWEDDPVQLLDPAYRGGANDPSLTDCQANFARIGACEERLATFVRPPKADETRDPEWRPVQDSDVLFARNPGGLADEEWRRPDAWYYWKRNPAWLTLRPATQAHFDFAYAVKRAAFKTYVDLVWGWDDDAQRGFHARRFAAQEFRIIHVDKTDVGYLAVLRTPDYLDVEQLFILPEHQSKGIGRACMLLVMVEARQQGLPVRLQVLKVNPRARAFYTRLGFVRSGETETHTQMEWKADAP